MIMAFDAEVIKILKDDSIEEVERSPGVIEYKLDIDKLNEYSEYGHLCWTIPPETWRQLRLLKLASKHIDEYEGILVARLFSDFCVIRWEHPLENHPSQAYRCAIPLPRPRSEDLTQALFWINQFHYTLSKDETYQSEVIAYVSRTL